MSDEKPAAGFVPLKSVTQGPPDPAAALAEIRQIYFHTTRETLEHDFAHAIELLKNLPDEELRAKAHVYMEGLAEMRKEWGIGQRKPRRRRGSAPSGRQEQTAGQPAPGKRRPRGGGGNDE